MYESLRWVRRTFGAVAFFAVMTGVSACGPQVNLAPVQGQVETPGAARVSLAEVDADILKFAVFNLTNQTMVVLRDEVYMTSRLGSRRRLPGGVSSVYNIAPGGAHDVNVRFDFDGFVAGDRVEVRFDRALVVAGSPIAIQPIALECR
ncbi:MAG TPA: hypothetical protein VF989_04545 [Polyangiaceae bacterium]|jgi:hypothetical protein